MTNFMFMIIVVIVLAVIILFGTVFGKQLRVKMKGRTDEVMRQDAQTPEGAKDYYNAAIREKEVINIKLDQIPTDYETIAVTVTIYDAENRLQNFGMVENAYVRVVDADTGEERNFTTEHLRALQKFQGNDRRHRTICEMRIKSI